MYATPLSPYRMRDIRFKRNNLTYCMSAAGPPCIKSPCFSAIAVISVIILSKISLSVSIGAEWGGGSWSCWWVEHWFKFHTSLNIFLFVFQRGYGHTEIRNRALQNKNCPTWEVQYPVLKHRKFTYYLLVAWMGFSYSTWGFDDMWKVQKWVDAFF